MAKAVKYIVHALTGHGAHPASERYFGLVPSRDFIAIADEIDEQVAKDMDLQVARLYAEEALDIIELICIQAAPNLIPFDDKGQAKRVAAEINTRAQDKRKGK